MKYILLFSAVLLGFLYVKFKQTVQLHPPPILDEPYWGPGTPKPDDTSIRPFKIQISNEVLADLKSRLDNRRPFTTPLENAKHHYGINTKLLEEIVTYWRVRYNWRNREELLNQYPHYKTQIQGLDIHYIHAKPKNAEGKKVIPLLILHGWPGSIKEFYKLIPLLITPQKEYDFVFEVIAPSLPGYGFSQGASKQGLGAAQMAVVFKNFMERLGYKKYYVQGGDFGAIILNIMAAMYEDRILGYHSNFCYSETTLSMIKLHLGALYPSYTGNKKFEERTYPLSNFYSNRLLETGYLHIQATKPDTIGVGLNDSPVGLAAYIIEKFIAGTNFEWKDRLDGGLLIKYKYDDILDDVMIYWVTNSKTTAIRLYSETFNKAHRSLDFENVPVNVPMACARFPREIVYQTECLLRDKFKNLIHVSDFDDGGHFAAMEVPNLLGNDIWIAINKFIETANKK